MLLRLRHHVTGNTMGLGLAVSPTPPHRDKNVPVNHRSKLIETVAVHRKHMARDGSFGKGSIEGKGDKTIGV